ncbi:unnamed protein product [Nippostrongylus brasiliensis]|uniref:Aspartate--tRNA ligase, mitochondrial (inferred by orthology to a human protein) n=1 Tax=Nippostrongylus brasiliensis TaxID=27835 RepID=A0A0N4YFW0_NIPBR|nr:unnamed protein product [Nippostrongylus brasiliensis]
MGWLAYKRMNRFLVLRDAYGTVQATVDPETDVGKVIKELSYESVVQVEGVVVGRGENANLKMKTGEIEINVSKLTILNHASPKIPLLPDADASELTRLTYRYIDLRTDRLQRFRNSHSLLNVYTFRALRMRSDVVHSMRRFLVEEAKFVDVETPTLFRRTPGGAAEFMVPAPAPNQGLCYSLPQSPQQFKQLLMIARCYRDEGAKGDRQPEFTQVDLEMSFTDQEGVMALVEQTIVSSWPEELADLKPTAPFPRLKYADAMRLYGSDKPDMRIPWQIQDCTELFFSCDCITLVNAKFQNFAVFDKTKRLWFKYVPYLEFVDRFGIEDGDLAVFSWGDEEGVQWTLGQLRNLIADVAELRKKRKICAHWIVDFPLFTPENGKLTTTHHPFTAPIDEHRTWLNDPSKLSQISGQHYDLVMNGVELGGGSIRIHNSDEQAKVLEILGEETKDMTHLLEALSYGAPPHGGFALGLDRYIALLAAGGNPALPVREVIAFPKSKECRDLMSKAPAAPTPDQLERYGVVMKNVAKEDDEAR